MYVCMYVFYYMLIHTPLYYNTFYLFVDSLTPYCVTLNNSNTKLNNNLLRTYIFNS